METQRPDTDVDVIDTEDALAIEIQREQNAAPQVPKENLARVILPPFVLGAAIIGFWYFISYGLLSERRRFLLRPPHEVLNNAFLDGDVMEEIMLSTWSSTKVAFFGLVIAAAMGLVLAVLMSQTKLVERAMFPYLVVLQSVPILAIVPLIGFWFGFGQTSRIVVCVIIAFFPLVVNTLFGLQSAERGMHDLFTLHNANRATRLQKLKMPAAMPAMFAGLRISAGLSVIGAIVGDFFFGQGEPGIGQRLRTYSNRLQGEELLAAVIISASLGVAVFLFFTWLQNRVVGKWYSGAGGSGV
ncbi:MAG: ABC transporter permease [Actinomycetota bacterium]